MTKGRCYFLLSIFILAAHGAVTYCPTGGVTSTDPDLYPCLWISTDKRNWFDALSVCEENGGTLVRIESQAQQDYIKSYQRNNENTWFGMNDLDEDNQFVWTDRQPATWYNWENRQPNGGDTQNCLVVNDIYEWEDKDCDELHYYACQYIAASKPVENVISPTSKELLDHEARLQKPDSSNGIQLMSQLTVEDQSMCVMYCLHNTDCTTLAYGPDKTPYNCLLYKTLAGGHAPLWRGWYTYTVVG